MRLDSFCKHGIACLVLTMHRRKLRIRQGTMLAKSAGCGLGIHIRRGHGRGSLKKDAIVVHWTHSFFLFVLIVILVLCLLLCTIFLLFYVDC